jgi:hypothetical protein
LQSFLLKVIGKGGAMNFVSKLNLGLKVRHLLNVGIIDFMFSDMFWTAFGEEVD